MTVPTFPALAGIGYPIRRTPLWHTLHQEAVSGRDNPLALWTYPKRRYTLPYEFLRKTTTLTEIQTLEGFYNQMYGSFGVFQFNDVDDMSVTDQVFGLGALGVTTFQLTRTWGGFTEPIWQPTAITNIKDNGGAAGSYNIGTNPGQIVFNIAPTAGHTLTWTGTYNWWCRFDDDSNDFEKFMNTLWELKAIKFTTLKYP